MLTSSSDALLATTSTEDLLLQELVKRREALSIAHSYLAAGNHKLMRHLNGLAHRQYCFVLL